MAKTHQHARFAVVLLSDKPSVTICEGLPRQALLEAQEKARRLGSHYPSTQVQIVPCGSAQASFGSIIQRAKDAVDAVRHFNLAVFLDAHRPCEGQQGAAQRGCR